MTQLAKSSKNEEVKMYFNAILELSKSEEFFPVSLDDVWPLVYNRKSDAVEALRRDFIENDDYKTMRQNPQGEKFAPTVYKLSLSYLEYFIARKVRPVFEVYRQVFHKTTTAIGRHGNSHIGKRTPALTTKVKASLLWIEGVSKTLNLHERTARLKKPLKYWIVLKVCVLLHCYTY